jgi:hypothetical protein
LSGALVDECKDRRAGRDGDGDGDGDADGDAEAEDCRGGEGGAAAQGAQREAEGAEEGVHGVPVRMGNVEGAIQLRYGGGVASFRLPRRGKGRGLFLGCSSAGRAPDC